MLKVRDLVRVQCLRRKGIRPFGMITAVGEPEKGRQKIELIPGDRLHPKIIQSKTRFVYGGLTATFINTILIHNGRLVQDCENGRNHFYLSSEKSLLCHLKDQVFYDFDRRVVCTLASTEVLVPVKARAEGIGWQGRMPLRNGSFF